MKQVTLHRVSIVPTLKKAYHGAPECQITVSDFCTVRSVQIINEELALVTILHGDYCNCTGDFAPLTTPKE